MSDEHACCCSDRKRQRTDEEYKRLMNRLSRIEGQIRGVKGMLENDAYCTDIVLQVSAINAALNSFNKVLLAEHIRTCVADDIRNGNNGCQFHNSFPYMSHHNCSFPILIFLTAYKYVQWHTSACITAGFQHN